MKSSLVPGVRHVMTYVVGREKTVPYLFPEAPGVAAMPEVLASGMMIGLMEWCCIDAMAPHLDEGEGSLGISFEVSHEAATPPGMTVTVEAVLEEVDGRRLVFSVIARDDVDIIGRGKHGRMVVKWQKFMEKVAQKAG